MLYTPVEVVRTQKTCRLLLFYYQVGQLQYTRNLLGIPKGAGVFFIISFPFFPSFFGVLSVVVMYLQFLSSKLS